MTENFSDSVVGQERAQRPAQQALKTVEALRTANVPHADVENLKRLTQRFHPLVDLQRNINAYHEGITNLADDPSVPDEERVDRYVALKQRSEQAHETAAAALRAEVEQLEKSTISSLFGINGSYALENEADRGARKASYREALYKHANQPADKLADSLELALYVGDAVTARAIGAVAAKRGEQAVTYQYLQSRGDEAMGKWSLLQTTPRGGNLDLLINTMAPTPVHRSEIGPSPRAEKAREQLERQQSFRQTAAFR